MLFAAAKIQCRVYIDGYYVPCDSIRITYPVNAIPICELTAVPGREMSTRLISIAHALKGLVYQIPLQVFLDIDQISGIYPVHFAAPGTYLLFDGYVENIQYERDITALRFFIGSQHWLYDLDFSSALSDAFHPTTPTDVTFNAFLHSGAGSQGPLIAVDEAAALLTPQEVLSDLWRALHKVLMHIASIDRFAYQYFYHRINDSPMRATARALSRFTIGAPPLTIDAAGIDPQMLAYSIITMLTNASTEYNPLSYPALAETTLWKRLSEVLAPMFQFAIIPYPTYARVVPYTPTLPYPYAVITPNAMFKLVRASKITKPYHAMVLTSNMRLPAGSDLLANPAQIDNNVGFGGLYKTNYEGLTFFRAAPPYTSLLSILPMMLIGPALDVFNRGNGYAFPGLRPMNDTNYQPNTVQWRQKYLLDKMAQYYFTMELLKERRMMVYGPLRLDIAPGSIVQLTSIGEKFIDQVQSDVYKTVTGYVSSLEFAIRSTRPHPVAFTNLEISYIRDGTQNGHPDFTVPAHPLYSTYFNGGRFI